MVHFLNELYSFMDKQIVKYDVYKVSRQKLLLASEEAFRKVRASLPRHDRPYLNGIHIWTEQGDHCSFSIICELFSFQAQNSPFPQIFSTIVC